MEDEGRSYTFAYYIITQLQALFVQLNGYELPIQVYDSQLFVELLVNTNYGSVMPLF